jgi:hypothetical protein
MRPLVIRTLLGAAALGLVGWGTLWALTPPAVVQPVQFPHKTHIEQSLECTSCHDRADKDLVAGRPPTALCLTCHAGGEPTGEIKKLQAFEGAEVPWRRVWRLPPHVFFSHRVHVAVAHVACQTCHGPMETLTRPPARPLRALTMEQCIACHEERSGRAEKAADGGPAGRRPGPRDCTTCHR